MPRSKAWSAKPVLEKVAFAAIMAVLAAGLDTWAEVKSLRREVDELRADVRELQKDNKVIWSNIGYMVEDTVRRDATAFSAPEDAQPTLTAEAAGNGAQESVQAAAAAEASHP